MLKQLLFLKKIDSIYLGVWCIYFQHDVLKIPLSDISRIIRRRFLLQQVVILYLCLSFSFLHCQRISDFPYCNCTLRKYQVKFRKKKRSTFKHHHNFTFFSILLGSCKFNQFLFNKKMLTLKDSEWKCHSVTCSQWFSRQSRNCKIPATFQGTSFLFATLSPISEGSNECQTYAKSLVCKELMKVKLTKFISNFMH